MLNVPHTHIHRNSVLLDLNLRKFTGRSLFCLPCIGQIGILFVQGRTIGLMNHLIAFTNEGFQTLTIADSDLSAVI